MTFGKRGMSKNFKFNNKEWYFYFRNKKKAKSIKKMKSFETINLIMVKESEYSHEANISETYTKEIIIYNV